MHKYKHFLLAAIFIISSLFCEDAASQDVQAWIDGFVVATIGNSFDNELNIGHQHLMTENGWHDSYIANTFGFQPWGFYRAEGIAEFHLVKDPVAGDYNEITGTLVQRFNFAGYIDKINLELPYFLIRLDQRRLDYTDLDTTEYKTRIRFRLGGRFLLNSDNISAGTFYLPFYAESFVNLNGEAYERFASRTRLVAGLGYIFNPRWRIEFDYYGQRSRNTVEDSFVKTDMIFQLQLRYFLLKNTN
jgi:hypothetical protein